jgi:hypothetical protein
MVDFRIRAVCLNRLILIFVDAFLATVQRANANLHFQQVVRVTSLRSDA